MQKSSLFRIKRVQGTGIQPKAKCSTRGRWRPCLPHRVCLRWEGPECSRSHRESSQTSQVTEEAHCLLPAGRRGSLPSLPQWLVSGTNLTKCFGH